MRFTWGSLAVVGVLVLFGTAACSHRAGRPAAEPEPSLGAIAHPRSLAEVGLPLDAYVVTPQQQVSLFRAGDMLTQNCMRRFGLTFPTIQRGVATVDPIRDRRLDFIGAERAARLGFRPERDPGNEERMRQAETLAAQMTSTQLAVLYGRNGPADVPKLNSYGGRPVPPKGCTGEAQEKLSEGAGEVDSMLVTQLMSIASHWAEADSRMRAVTGRWSGCMARAGYRYTTPKDALNDSRWSGDAASGREIAAAVAYARCQDEVNWLGVSAAVQTAYQQREVERNADGLAKAKRHLQTQLRNAAALVGGPAGTG
jgi:hypothetical protein